METVNDGFLSIPVATVKNVSDVIKFCASKWEIDPKGLEVSEGLMRGLFLSHPEIKDRIPLNGFRPEGVGATCYYIEQVSAGYEITFSMERAFADIGSTRYNHLVPWFLNSPLLKRSNSLKM